MKNRETVQATDAGISRKIAWLVTAPRFDIASIRYRAIYPAAGLEKSGWTSVLVSRPEDLKPLFDDLDAIIIVKRLDAGMLSVVSQANDRGVPVFLDLCDDVLHADYRGDQHELFRMVFEAIAPRLAGLVVTGEVLKRRFAQYGFPEDRIHTVPDCIEDDGVIALGKRFLDRSDSPGGSHDAKAAVEPRAPEISPSNKPGMVRRVLSAASHPRRSALDVRRTWRFIAKGEAPVAPPASPPPKLASKSGLEAALRIEGRTVIWFGNHGGPHSDFGMLTLLRVADALRSAHARAPFTLVVVSDHYDKWKLFVHPLGVPSVYVPWTQEGCHQLLEKAWAFVMPVGEDEFSLAKSANRVLLATELGIPTVSQALEGLGPLANRVAAEDFEESLVRCLSNRSKSREQVMHARVEAHAAFGLPVIVRDWNSILANARPYLKSRNRYGLASVPEKLLVVINIAQDAALALPVIDEARRRGHEVGVVVSREAMQNNSRLLAQLVERKIAPTYLSPGDFKVRDFRWLRGATALLSPTDTSAPPHQLSHRLTHMAKAAGVRTFTVQHGLENIGLTVQDPEFPDAVIASDTIFTWNSPDRLPEWLDMQVRARCIGVGRLSYKGTPGDPDALRSRLDLADRTIAIFENLHWRRYDDAYRKQFADSVAALAAARPDHTLLVVPHPAGRWSMSNAAVFSHPNVRLLDRADKASSDIDLAAILHVADAVITTPSTVAVDACEEGLPVAIAGHGLDVLSTYQPLTILTSAEDWIAFIDRSLQDRAGGETEQFLARVQLSGDAAAAIVDHIFRGGAADVSRASLSRENPVNLSSWKQVR